MKTESKQNFFVAALTLIALGALLASYFVPIWWVSLTAPNYPKEAFPQGIRIHFHFDGVYNGCTDLPKSRLTQETEQRDLGDDLADREGGHAAKPGVRRQIGLDCLHEMNTINHYVGMYPIETGAPVERPLAKFFFTFFAVMMVAFVLRRTALQLTVLGVGFAAIAVWMVLDLYVTGTLDPFIANYMEEAGRFFKEPGRIATWGATLRTVTGAVVAGLIAAMVIVIAGVWKVRNFQLLLALVPALLPVFFVMDYAGWLWFFGHNLHPWGAFTVKPFMPTVFGEGKVAQFSTFSYPHYGYGLLLLIFVTMIPAMLIRRKQLREQGGDTA
jgi:hypothetical protein